MIIPKPVAKLISFIPNESAFHKLWIKLTPSIRIYMHIWNKGKYFQMWQFYLFPNQTSSGLLQSKGTDGPWLIK